MNEPTLVSRDALTGQKIALSVSKSADLLRLGLTEWHCRLVVAEVGRAIMLAGGTVVYGGNLQAGGYTRVLIEEAQRFGGGRLALEVMLAESEYRELEEEQMLSEDRSLGEIGRLTLVAHSGKAVLIRDALAGTWVPDPTAALTAMREYVANETTARLVVGGRLADYVGAEPGVVEEARLTLLAQRPLLVAGGYGGAAAAVAKRLRPQDFSDWVPENYPQHADEAGVSAALDALEAVHASSSPIHAFDEGLLHTLTISHRPADIATATVLLLSQVAS